MSSSLAIDKLRSISKKSDEDKIVRLERAIAEANQCISDVAEAAGEAIKDCNDRIERIKRSVEIIQNKGVTISNHTNQQSGDNATNKQAGEINE